MIDRGKIEELVRRALVARGTPGQAAPPAVESGGGLMLRPDRGVNLGTPEDPRAMRALLGATPARVAVGRAGTRYRTNTMLRFRADHAFARDAVLSEVAPELLSQLGVLEVRSAASDKAEFLTRPDLGRRLSDEARAELPRHLGRAPQLVILYGDGLSAAAVTAHLPAFHEALGRDLAARGVRPATPCFIRYSRVKIMDEVAQLLDAEAALFVCGERPGLGFADSLSAYYIYRPAVGATDAHREVVSNINPRGLTPVAAAGAVADNVARVLREKKSGVL